MAADGSSGFAINSEEGEFKSRCDDIFGGLASLEKKHDAFASAQSRNRDDAERRHLVKPDPREDPVQPQPRDRGSFRRPYGRARHPRYRPTPGFKKNPENWTSYDLSDVSRDQLSERSNTAAALAFLQERRQARASKEDQTPADLSKKVEFSHRSKSEHSSDTSESGEKKFRGGKLVMPEYDMGQKKIKPKWQRVAGSGTAGSSSRSVNLDYLQNKDEDDEMEVDSNTVSKSLKRKTVDSDVNLGDGSVEEVTDKDNTKCSSQGSDSCSTDKPEIKFKKVAGKKGIRRRQRDDDEDGVNNYW